LGLGLLLLLLSLRLVVARVRRRWRLVAALAAADPKQARAHPQAATNLAAPQLLAAHHLNKLGEGWHEDVGEGVG
jgi:hypothetical protein